MRKTVPPLIPQPVFMLFGKQSGGQIAALKSWNMPKVFVQQSCGLHHPCTQTDVVALSRQSAFSRPAAPQHGICWLNTVYRSAICLDVVFFPLYCVGLEGWRVGGKGADFDCSRIAWRLVLSSFCSVAPAHGSSSRLVLEFEFSLELQPGMCCWKDKRDPSIKQLQSCKSIAWNFHGLSHGLDVIFLALNTKWYVTAMNNYPLYNPISFRHIIPSSDI